MYLAEDVFLVLSGLHDASIPSKSPSHKLKSFNSRAEAPHDCRMQQLEPYQSYYSRSSSHQAVVRRVAMVWIHPNQCGDSHDTWLEGATAFVSHSVVVVTPSKIKSPHSGFQYWKNVTWIRFMLCLRARIIGLLQAWV